MIIDIHHHLLAGDDYVDGLLRAMDACDIGTACLSGLGLPSDNWVGDMSPTNDDVERAVNAHPDRLIGFAAIRLGDHCQNDVRQLRDRGFVGLKTTRPRYSYDDPRNDEIYRTAEELKMPFLFHTGFTVRFPQDRRDDVSSDRCRPVALDRVARTFPDLVVIMAHLGMPWHEEAAQMCRFHPNVYTDLSASLQGWRRHKAPDFLTELFYWPGAFGKILFGSDVHHTELAQALVDYRRIFLACGLVDDVSAGILGDTAATLLGLGGGTRR